MAEKLTIQFSSAENEVRNQIVGVIKEALGEQIELGITDIEYPPQADLGDYSVPCFLLAKQTGKAPGQVAELLTQNFKPTELLLSAKALGPYFNFWINPSVFNKLVLTEINKAKDKYGDSDIGHGQRVMVEFFSPNTNKPLTIGHVRNICLGDAIARLLKFSGYKTIRSTLYNDRGIAIAKTILGYQKWGNSKNPKQAKLKPDHFVGSFYVKFAQAEKDDKNLEQEARRVLQAWEEGKKNVRKIWERLITWVLEGFSQTLAKLDIEKFDEDYHESEYYQEGKKIVQQGLDKDIFIKSEDGVVAAKLEQFGLPDKILLRPDDTSLYITQDLYLAYLKDRHKLDSSIYVVGSEQDLYLQQLFKILELLGFANAKNYHHLSYGMIRLPEGRIKSREGLAKGTGADELIAELEYLAKLEIKKREKEIAESDLKERAEKISIGALKFYILAVNPKTTMVFKPQESIAFTGRTGPYLQYVYARINSIFEKADTKITSRVDFAVLTQPEELALIKILAKFPRVISDAVNKFDPSEVANYLYDLAKAFSLFYEKVPVLQAESKIKKARLLLLNDTQMVLANGLRLLGISTLEKM
ncbi:MAG: arginine--tRNA ligase [Patescibacteria group bacterium]|jgi:arginyl-tRNA synthetase|nr:arginine--tRNA ligase [Patescibacteria group bacterium]